MVRLISFLCRVPVIKFRKGGLGQQAAAAGATAATSPNAVPSQPGAPTSAPMSTSSIPDFALPLRYRRRPMSQEEIDTINGGGIADPSSTISKSQSSDPSVALVKVPKGLLVKSGSGKKDAVVLNIVVQKGVC